MAQPYDPHCYTSHVCHGTGQVISIDNTRLVFQGTRGLGLHVIRMGEKRKMECLDGKREEPTFKTGVDRSII